MIKVIFSRGSFFTRALKSITHIRAWQNKTNRTERRTRLHFDPPTTVLTIWPVCIQRMIHQMHIYFSCGLRAILYVFCTTVTYTRSRDVSAIGRGAVCILRAGGCADTDEFRTSRELFSRVPLSIGLSDLTCGPHDGDHTLNYFCILRQYYFLNYMYQRIHIQNSAAESLTIHLVSWHLGVLLFGHLSFNPDSVTHLVNYCIFYGLYLVFYTNFIYFNVITT